MSAIFPKWTNRLPAQILAGATLLGCSVVAGVWYYFTPKYTRVGYEPLQPTPFSHAVHVDQLGMDCRYCHHGVEQAWFANVPSAAACMNCHNQVLPSDDRLAPVRESFQSGQPIPWVQVHKVPDYVYFNHAVHINRGVSCVHCHGQLNRMDEVYHAQPLSMTFCLDCHRDPAPNLRPLDKITDLDWAYSDDPVQAQSLAREEGQAMVRDWKIQPTDQCSNCHR